MNNRLLTPKNTQLVGLDGAAVSSKAELEVIFRRQTRIVIDKITRKGAPVDFTQVECDGKVVAWMMTIPKPQNMPNPLDHVVWGFYGPTGEMTMGAMLREKAELQAQQFARAVALQIAEENQAG